MDQQLFHIYRNTPAGRETIMQSLYFCKMIGAYPVVYIPEFTKFLMYFENDIVQVDLDDSYLTSPETAEMRAAELLKEEGFDPKFLKPKNYTASALPDIPINFDFMCCPRSISDLSSKIGLSYIGPRVRRIVKSAHFPVLLTSPVFKKWHSVTLFFGGSANAIKALKLALHICRESGLPLDIFTYLESGYKKEYYEKIIKNHDLEKELKKYRVEWQIFDKGTFEENLYEVKHDSLAVLGAFGHGIIKDILFGSKMEMIQSTIYNNLLIVGPNYKAYSMLA